MCAVSQLIQHLLSEGKSTHKHHQQQCVQCSTLCTANCAGCCLLQPAEHHHLLHRLCRIPRRTAAHRISPVNTTKGNARRRLPYLQNTTICCTASACCFFDSLSNSTAVKQVNEAVCMDVMACGSTFRWVSLRDSSRPIRRHTDSAVAYRGKGTGWRGGDLYFPTFEGITILLLSQLVDGVRFDVWVGVTRWFQ